MKLMYRLFAITFVLPLPAVANELNNLADQHSETRDRLTTKLAEYLESVEAQIPFHKESGTAVPYPDS